MALSYIDGVLYLDGEPFQRGDAASIERVAKLAPNFVQAAATLGRLIATVDHEAWQQTALQELIRLFNAMDTEVFGVCCPADRATVHAIFEAAVHGVSTGGN